MAASCVSNERRGVPPVPVVAVALSLGKPMPRVGFGTASATLGQAEGRAGVADAVLSALNAGYRHLDTASAYNTEAALGDAVIQAVRDGIVASRDDDLYITTKLSVTDTHPGRVLPALHESLRSLQIEYVDLYLVHFPVSMRPPVVEGGLAVVKEDLVEMDMRGVWEEMEECHRRGLARAIGVSNFTCKKLEYLLSFAKIPPAANQVEVHPYCRQNKLRAFCTEKGIQLCAFSPLGAKGTPWANNSVMECPVLKQIAHERNKSIAQINIANTKTMVCIRWVFEQGDCVIAKSFNKKRMRENLDIFDWQLTEDDCRKISTLPESRGTYDFFVHESGPYKTAQEFWDGEIVAGQSTNQTAVRLDPTNL